jgi:ferritin-like metal-binding protein YciE
MALKSPMDLLTQELKEIHSAERQLSRALPKLAKAVSSQRLQEMLETRREQGAALIEAVDEALEELGATRSRKKNEAIDGLIGDANQHVEEINDEKMLDAALIGAVQKVQHYCIAAWGTVASFGRLFEQEKVVEVMERAPDEGKRFDEEMTQLAESEINPAMLGQGEESGMEAEGAEEEEDEAEGGGRKGSSRKKQGGTSAGRNAA